MDKFNSSGINKEREQKLLNLYKDAFPMVAGFISKRGGSFEQAKDVFHDALVIWYEKAYSNNDHASSDKAYVFGIARHLWFRNFSAESKMEGLEILIDNDFAEVADTQPSTSRLLNLLEHAGKRCMDLLKSFYYDKLSINELASGFGFGSERSATVQKYKCLEKVRDTVKQKSLQYEDFLE